MINNLTQSDMEAARIPPALPAWYYAKYEETQSNKNDVKRAKLSKRLYKESIEQIYTLVLYSRWRFLHDGVVCQPKTGSREYDAIKRWVLQPDYVHTVEVTWPQDGEECHAVAEVMNRHGFLGRNGDESEQDNQGIDECVLGGTRDKSTKNDRSLKGSPLPIVLDTACSSHEQSERIAQISSLSR